MNLTLLTRLPQLPLGEVSPEDRQFGQRKRIGLKLANLLRGTSEAARAKKYRDCANVLGFTLKTQPDGTQKFKLSNARFCRDPYCPLCMAARSRAKSRHAAKALPQLVADRPDLRYLFMTLTVKNCPIGELRKTISKMQKSFIKMISSKNFCQLGYIRAVEVTRDKNNPGYAHPHFHILLAVPPEYFDPSKDLYISQSRLSDLWLNYYGSSYRPIVDIRAVKFTNKNTIANSVSELIKYVTKSSDLLVDKEWTLEYMSQMLYVKRVTTGGIFKQYLKNFEEEPDDLIGTDDTEELSVMKVCFRWSHKIGDYVLVNFCEEKLQKPDFITQEHYSTSVL